MEKWIKLKGVQNTDFSLSTFFLGPLNWGTASALIANESSSLSNWRQQFVYSIIGMETKLFYKKDFATLQRYSLSYFELEVPFDFELEASRET